MRLKIFLPAALIAALLAQAHGQPPSGEGRGGFGRGSSTDRNERFSQYSGGGDTWDRSRLTDPDQLRRFDMMAQQLGITTGLITRQQYLGYYQQRDQMGGASRGGFGGPPMTITMPGNSPTVAPPAATGTEGRSRSGFGGSGGMSSWMERRFHEYDRNGDGVLSNDELPESMRNERAQWDTNGDGVIDLNEYLAYAQARMQQFQTERASNGPGGFGRPGSPNGSANPGSNPNETSRAAFDMSSMRRMDGGSGGGFDPNMMRGSDRGGMGFSRQREPEPPPRPTVYRPGNLPRELPSWFAQRDTDNDGQIALYEWRASGASLEEFQLLDANNDGFVTVEEVLRAEAAKQRNGSTGGTAVAATESRNLGGRDSFGSRGGRGGSTPSFDFSAMRSAGDGPDRERMMELMSRARENYLRNGGASPSPADFLKEAMGSGSNSSNDRGGFGRGRGPGGNGSGESRDGSGGPRRGRGPGGSGR